VANYLEAAHAIGYADDAETPHSGISVGGESGALFVTGIDDAHFALFKERVKSERVIAGYAEDMTHAQSLKPADQIIANGEVIHGKCNSMGGYHSRAYGSK
jgi:hypothetical protein